MSRTSLSLPSSFSSMLPRCAAAFSLANLSLNSPSPSMPTSGMFDVFAEPSAQAFSFRFHRSPPSLPSSFHPLPLFTCFLAFFSFDSKINLYLKAVRTGNAAVGVRGTDTIVLGVKKRSTAKLQDSSTVDPISKPPMAAKTTFALMHSNITLCLVTGETKAASSKRSERERGLRDLSRLLQLSPRLFPFLSAAAAVIITSTDSPPLRWSSSSDRTPVSLLFSLFLSLIYSKHNEHCFYP